MLFTPKAYADECKINGTDDFFKTVCDITGTYVTPSSSVLGFSALGSDLTMENTETSTSSVDLGNESFPIIQTRILMKYKGKIRVPILRYDSSLDFSDRITASSRITYTITGAIEWRSDVRGGTGQIEGGAWTPENPPDEDGNSAAGVAGRINLIRFDAELDLDSLPCCERVRASNTRMSFYISKIDDIVKTDLGLGRGIKFTFSPGNGSTLLDCGSETCTENTDINWYAPSSVAFDLGAVKPLIDIEIPNGKINIQLQSTEPVETDPGKEFEKANFNLYLQDGFIKDQQPGESDETFQQRISATRKLVKQCNDCNLSNKSGKFSLNIIPLLELISTGGSKVLRPAFYTLEITGVEAEEIDVSSETGETNTVIFTDSIVRNLRSDIDEPYAEKLIEVTPIDEIGKKEKLVVELSKIGPNNYSVTEAEVQQFLEEVKATKTAEELEAIRRGILAERIALSAARFAEPLITTMLGGFENLVKDLIDELEVKKGKNLADGEKKLKALQDKLDVEKLKAKKWKLSSDTEAIKKIKTQMGELIGKDKSLLSSFIGKVGKTVSKGIFSLVNEALLLAKIEKGPAKEIADYMATSANTVFGIIITQSIGGGKKAIAKQLIHEVLRNQAKTLLDGQGFISYTSLTEESLKQTLALMKTWDDDNKDQFLLDRTKFNLIDKEMGDAVLEITGGITAYSTEIADALGGFGGDVIDGIGDFGGPVGKGLALGTKIVKYTSNATTFGMPFITVYGILSGSNVDIPLPIYISPALRFIFGEELKLGLVEKGAAAAFGLDELPSSKPSIYRSDKIGPLVIKPNTLVVNDHLSSNLDATQSFLTETLDALTLAIAEDRIDDGITLLGNAEQDQYSFLNLTTLLERSVSYITATSQNSMLDLDSVGNLISDNHNLQLFSSGVSRLASNMYFKILLLEYTGPEDSIYIAERTQVLSAIESYRNHAELLLTDAKAVFNDTKDDIGQPVVVVDIISITSNTTGANHISSSSEEFTLRARVKNISSTAVAGLSGKLTVNSTENSITLATGSEVSLDTGSLAADDGISSTGEDEAELVWQFTYNGEPSDNESILFSIDLLENSTEPTTLNTFSNATVLEPKLSLIDNDLDGLPDNWEEDNNLDSSIDDAEVDVDGDDLSNKREFNLGTNPQKNDTDDDGLSDGEETTGGEDGFITDPLNDDSDNDGVLDGSDGHPLDGSTSTAPIANELIGEPVVSISTNKLALTKNEPVATVQVTNSGNGTLSWTAVSDNEAIIFPNPSAPQLRNGDGTVLISAAPGIDLESIGLLQANITIIDLSGTKHDSQTISVSIGQASDNGTTPDTDPNDGTDPGQVDDQDDTSKSKDSSGGFFGCSLNNSTTFDPSLIILLFLSVIYLIKRHR